MDLYDDPAIENVVWIAFHIRLIVFRVRYNQCSHTFHSESNSHERFVEVTVTIEAYLLHYTKHSN